MAFERVKLGLALGAGGARGLAHVGVLKALERAGVRISFLAGSSAGAVVGAAYAVSGSAAELERRFMEFLSTDAFKQAGVSVMHQAFQAKPVTLSERLNTWLKKAFIQAKIVSQAAVLEAEVFERLIAQFVPDVLIEDLPLPFQALGTDLNTGRAVVFKRGPLREALYASAAIPGVVRPLARGDMRIVDGGVIHMVPVLPVRHMGADVVLAVDVEKFIDPGQDFSSAFDLFFRVEDVQSHYLKETELRQADLVLQPKVGHIHWSDFGAASEMIRLGQDEVYERLDQVRTLARRRRLPWWLFSSPPPPPVRDWIEA
ncbi:MAG: patatin-like phospholipase family protein [Proteobacteria bacterium]|nr:patatin-like phospholipase family protein [Pseudomonadota bacterium]